MEQELKLTAAFWLEDPKIALKKQLRGYGNVINIQKAKKSHAKTATVHSTELSQYEDVFSKELLLVQRWIKQ